MSESPLPDPPCSLLRPTTSPSRSRVASHARPMALWHFADPRHWTPKDARAAVDQSSQAMLDEVVLAGFRLFQTRRPSHELRSIHAEALLALEVYRKAGWLDYPYLAHTPQTAPADDEIVITPRSAGGQSYEHLSFPSGYVPHPDDPSSAHWQELEANRTAHAWVLRHPEPRPWIVCVHGATMGRPRSDFQILKVAWLHHRLGLNVAMPILPLHGPRKVRDAHFPSENVLHNQHGALQGVADVRRTIAWIRSLPGDHRIALHGISLGGFTTSMVAGLEPDLDCAILGVAPVDLVKLLERHHGAGHGHDLRARNFEVAAQLTPMLSPLRLQPLLPRERRFIYAGVADQLVDFSTHVAPMIAHWDYPETFAYDGGHVGIGMARRLPGFIARALAASGLIAARAGSRPG